MVLITSGTGSTFKAQSAEGILLEMCVYMQTLERYIPSNPTGKDNIQISLNLNDMTTAISFSIPAEQSIDSSGKVTLSAVEYLQNVTFSPGTGGTFKSTTLCQYFLEVVTFLQIKENNTISNSQLINNVTSTYDADDKLFTGSATLPIGINFNDDGHPVIYAASYLV